MPQSPSVKWLNAETVCRTPQEQEFWMQLAQEMDDEASRTSDKALRIKLHGQTVFVREQSGVGMELADLSIDAFRLGAVAYTKEKLNRKDGPPSLNDAAEWLSYDGYLKQRATSKDALSKEARALAWSDLRDGYDKTKSTGSTKIQLNNQASVECIFARERGGADGHYWIKKSDAAIMDRYAQRYQRQKAGPEWTALDKIVRSPTAISMVTEFQNAYEASPANPDASHIHEVNLFGRSWQVAEFGTALNGTLHIQKVDAPDYWKLVDERSKDDTTKGAIAQLRKGKNPISPENIRNTRDSGGFFEL